MSMTNVVDVIVAGIKKKFQMNNFAAKALALDIVLGAAEEGHSGTEYYWPALHALTREQRNEAIRREFNGSNLGEVRRKYGVGKTTVYRAVRRGE